MPAVELMGWNTGQKRWFKKYRGKMYAVSPRRLGCEPTKEASRSAANDWWLKKQTAIDKALGEAKKHPAHITKQYQEAMERHRLYSKWQRRYGDPKQAEESESVMEWLAEALKTDTPPYPLTPQQQNPVIDLTATDHHQYVRWLERFNQIRREEAAEQAPPAQNTIRSHIDDYMTTLKAVAVAKGKLGSYDTARHRLTVFRRWCDPTAPIESLNEALWERFCLFLFGLVEQASIAHASMAGIQRAVRSFIKDRYSRRFIELPRNLTAKNLAATVPLKEPEVFTVAELRQLLNGASERKRLYLLLMLNTGCYPVDIAKLEQEEVDWVTGRISRKRTKTRDRRYCQ